MAKSKVDSKTNKPASNAGGKIRRNKKADQYVQFTASTVSYRVLVVVTRR
jgi:hypothetical protein